ncbi:protein translocase subunit SecF [Candidatus Solincola sp.]|nr:protein translocase subunit SecF [Actinomycetota bacterium]MDI7252047.1 protein translocase subunit SecF [Actinomycetota bacterium]
MFIRGREIKYNLVGGKAFSPPNVYWIGFSTALIVISVAALAVLGINLGIEFKGGYLVKMRLQKPADVGEVRGILAGTGTPGLEKSIVQAAEDNRVLILRMPYIEDSQARQQAIESINLELDRIYGIDEVLQEEQVGSEWGREVSQKAIIALAVFLAVILVYITLRLEFKMAVTAIVALIHDTLITVGIYALTRRQVTPVTVIAFLTILGYSLYDTIVVFDRVEENTNLLARSGRMTFSGIVNESVNQTLMRSIGTTLTTLLPIITILVFGGETLKDFAFALFLGVLLGGYSSTFIASPLLAMWKEREPRYAAVRERVDVKGAREAILITRPAATRSGEEPAPPPREAEAKPEAAGARSREGTNAQARKPAPAKGGSGQRKKATTKGPSGGKKKKKKKK